MLLCRLLVLVGNHEVVHYAFLDKEKKSAMKRRKGGNVVLPKTYDRGLLLVKVALVLLDALLAAEEHVPISQVSLLSARIPSQGEPTWDVIVTCGVCLDAEFGISPL